jgi:PAS domain S-box-containing protein
VSPGYEALFGRTCESLYADPASWQEAIHPDDRRKMQAALYDSTGMRTAAQFEFEYRIVRPDGSLRWIRTRGFPILDANGKLERIAGFAVDTTHQTKLEVVVQDDCRHFRDLVDALHLPCFMANTQGRITYCNDAALELTGWSRPELLGRPCGEILPDFAPSPLAGINSQWSARSGVVTINGLLGATTWHHMRLPTHEGENVDIAIMGEWQPLEISAAAPMSA